MNLPLHLLRLLAASGVRTGARARNTPQSDNHVAKPIFRPPALPTPQQISNELPFTVHLGPRLRERP